MATIASVLDQLAQVGFFRIVLPFLFTFAVVYGVVSRIELFGEESNEQVSAIIGLAAAFFVTNYVVTTGVSVSILFSNFFGALSVVFLFILSALIVQGVAGGSPGEGGRFNQAVMLVGALAVVSIFLSWGGLGFVFPTSPQVAPGAFLTSTTFVTILVILGAAVLIAYVTGIGFGGGGEEAEEGEEGEG